MISPFKLAILGSVLTLLIGSIPFVFTENLLAVSAFVWVVLVMPCLVAAPFQMWAERNNSRPSK